MRVTEKELRIAILRLQTLEAEFKAAAAKVAAMKKAYDEMNEALRQLEPVE